MKRVLFTAVLLFGFFGNIWAYNQVIEPLIGYWFVVEKNYNYSSEDSVNYEEIVINNFVFNEDGTGFWMVEREKKHSNSESEKNEEKFSYKWKILDDKIVFDFYEMDRVFESDFDISDSILTLSDPEGNIRKYSKKRI
ncbi:MAG: hypothetical protein JXL97_01970 [Bacteroidales bacterium]|nr:hypothetical protein [Bacteroidales bacterium]